MSVGIIVQGMAKDHEKVVETSFKEEAEKNNFAFKRTEDGALITMCNLGEVYVTLGKHGKIILDSSTSLLGAGFHHEVCLFIEKLIPYMGNVVVQDETGYYADRDLEKLHKEHFVKYLKQLVEELTKNIDANDLANGKQYGMKLVHWNINHYTPETINNSIATPYGRFSYKRILEIKEKELYEEFAQDFYIWSKIEKDAIFFRNAALNIMWDHLHYFRSKKYAQELFLNRQVIMLLEEAVKRDVNVPFPIKEYLEVCKLADHRPIQTKHLKDYNAEYTIGYRKGIVFQRFGKINVAADGVLLFEELELPTWFSSDDDWKNIEVGGNVFETQAEMDEEFNTLHEKLKKETLMQEVVVENAKAYIGYAGKNDNYHVSFALVANDLQITTVTFKYKSKKNHAWATDLVKRYKVVK